MKKQEFLNNLRQYGQCKGGENVGVVVDQIEEIKRDISIAQNLMGLAKGINIDGFKKAKNRRDKLRNELEELTTNKMKEKHTEGEDQHIFDWLEGIINGVTGFKAYEQNEAVDFADRELGIAEFVIQSLANDKVVGSKKVLESIIDQRRDMNNTYDELVEGLKELLAAMDERDSHLLPQYIKIEKLLKKAEQ